MSPDRDIASLKRKAEKPEDVSPTKCKRETCPVCCTSNEVITLNVEKCKEGYMKTCRECFKRWCCGKDMIEALCTCCRSKLDDKELFKIFDAKDLEDVSSVWIKNILSRDPNYIHCPKEDCKGVGFTDDANMSCVTCRECEDSFCVSCREKVHEGKCEDLEENKENFQWFKSHTQFCPKCHVKIEKGLGCAHMTCAKCTEQFCWHCRAPWTDAHRCAGVDSANGRLYRWKIRSKVAQVMRDKTRADMTQLEQQISTEIDAIKLEDLKKQLQLLTEKHEYYATERKRAQSNLMIYMPALNAPANSSRFCDVAHKLINRHREKDTEHEGTVEINDPEAEEAVLKAAKNITQCLATQTVRQGRYLWEDIIGILAAVRDAKQQYALFAEAPLLVTLNREGTDNVESPVMSATIKFKRSLSIPPQLPTIFTPLNVGAHEHTLTKERPIAH